MQGAEWESRDALRRGPPATPPPVPPDPAYASPFPPPVLPAAPPIINGPPPVVWRSTGEASVAPPPLVTLAAPPIVAPAAPPLVTLAAPPIIAAVAGPPPEAAVAGPGWAPALWPAAAPPMAPTVQAIAPPARPSAAVAGAAAVARTVAREPADAAPWNLDWLTAAFVSAAFHLVTFSVLAVYVSNTFPPFQQELLLAVSTEPEELGSAVQEFGSPTLVHNLDAVNVYSSFVGEASIPLPAGEERLVIDEKLAPREDPMARPEHLDREARRIDKGALTGGDKAAQPRVAEVATAQQALDGVLGELGSRATKQDLLVVWLFDASISLRDERQQIAGRLSEFFQKQDAQPEEKKRLMMSAAVAFGSGVIELEAPTRSGQKIVEAAGRVPVDTTGMERTFVAIKWAAERYTKRKGQLMIVVWTDESGDDQQELEPAIQACTKHRALVSVVGPTAALGRIYGRQSWPNPGGDRPFSLQVNRGPDSPAPERLLLPYWFNGRFPSWGEWGEVTGDEFPPWYGGPQMEYMLCGLGPYALLRLVMATGGTYTLLDRLADRSPFRIDLMRPYLPSYQSLKEYYDENRRRGLRQAVLSAAEITLAERNWPPPRLEIEAPQSQALDDEIRIVQAQARRALVVINRALLSLGRDGMEKQYDQEKSLRWRAWYDLTRGRLLAGLVRYTEYDFLCTLFLRNGLRSGVSRVRLTPAATLRAGAGVQAASAEAERFLKRCLDKNPKTPWAYLAQRELDYPLGLDFQQQVTPARPLTLPRQGKPGTARPSSNPSPVIPPRL